MSDRKVSRWTIEEKVKLLDAITVCIVEHPIVGQWITEILDRKIEPNSSEKPNNCEACKYEDLESYEGACDDCTDMEGRPTNYEPKTEPQTDEEYINNLPWTEAGNGEQTDIEIARAIVHWFIKDYMDNAMASYEWEADEPQTERSE